MENMFYYIEKLVALEDLSITTVLAKEILDLYADIVLNCFNYLVHNQSQNGTGPSPADISEFERYVKRSEVHMTIEKRFGSLV